MCTILALKTIRSPIDRSVSYYDQLVRFHQLAVQQARLELRHGNAARAPAFLPWHRKLLLMFESAVRMAMFEPRFALPYWDWTDDSSLEVVFSDDLMGPEEGDPDDSYAVTSGPFRKGCFPINVRDDRTGQCPFPFLTRGAKSGLSLPTVDDVAALLEVETGNPSSGDVPAAITQSFRHYLVDASGFDSMRGMVRLHSLPRAWVGGTWNGPASGPFQESPASFVGSMAELECAPNDPAYWLHQCNIDRIWAILQAKFGSRLETSCGEIPGWSPDAELYPYVEYQDHFEVSHRGLTSASMLDFMKLGYTYQEL